MAKKKSSIKKKQNLVLEEEKKEKSDDKEVEEEVEDLFLDTAHFFQYQRALNILIDYLNQSIEEIIAGFPPSDQKSFAHGEKKLILNSVLEVGFYEFCKFRLASASQAEGQENEEAFMKSMEEIQGEIDLIAFLLVNTRMAHRTLNFDLYLSLLKGGLFEDILTVHGKMVQDMQEKKQKVSKESIKDLRVDNLYI